VNGKVPECNNKDVIEAIKSRAAAAELRAKRYGASILSDKGGLMEAGDILSQQECATARAWKPD
jgi:hypothetical protein